MSDRRKLTVFILIRILLVSFFLISTLILRMKAPGSIEGWAFRQYILLIIAAYVFSLASLAIASRAGKLTFSIAYFQVIWDILFVTALLVITGGIASPFSFLYLLSIINASVLLSRREAFYTASLCSIIYGALIDLQYYGFLNSLGLTQGQFSQYDNSFIFYTIFINISGYFLTAFLTGYLAERALRSERALEETTLDLNELTLLHSAIVTSLNSGLMTLDSEQRIRVFNGCAEQLTGLSQSDLFGRPLEAVMPEFLPVITKYGVRSEVMLKSANTAPRVLGCSASPLISTPGNHSGVVINFQDVTEFKRMASELKRSAQLAAVGELSARIAHEIRNPLAAISGSVQLIAQHSGISGEEQKLFEIVVKETDRLNTLIRDFLAYARPHPPQFVQIPLSRLLDTMMQLMVSDARFKEIIIRRDFIDSVLVRVDVDQFIQVLWNIFVNSADAMPQGGIITISFKEISSPDMSVAYAHSWGEISISDTGAGMTPDDLSHVFEPFFTTKRSGTGLGLATVYRIIEGHGGHITVESTPGRGTVFVLTLPYATD